ncbi:MAG: cation acetate symporter [Verrucomicrobiales bacterium]|nr:cation acetate symporter [Verrucomicrobiales bacterium]|tara:strand:+ start:4232 stop:6016 length:1785 start_codon:yes stop_codon:yes gene_type:complete
MNDQTIWNLVFVIASFSLYIGIAIWARVQSTKGFYVAGQGVPTVLNGMATGADWMSAASFMGMAGLISVMGYTGSMYLIGWTGGYVLLAMLLAPYLRKFGKFTVPDFVGDRYYSNLARVVAIICAIFVSFTYVCGQMRGVGIVFANLLGWDITLGVVVGIGMVFFYATLGGMKGITYTQVAQYCVLISAFVIPAIGISYEMTGNAIPQIGFGSKVTSGDNAGLYLLEALDKIHTDLGLPEYTAAFVAGKKSKIDVLMITIALMVGTAGLPHVIIRFYTVKTVGAARWSAFWALVFIGMLYTTAPAVGAFARANLLQTTHNKAYKDVPGWFKKWEDSGLIAWVDKNGDGNIQFGKGAAFVGKPKFDGDKTDAAGQRLITNAATEGPNELYVDRDIMVLANPEIAKLPPWVVALVAAGGLAAALSTAAGLLLVISSSVSHDLMKSILKPNMSEKEELVWARVAAGVAVVIAGYFGINPPDYVAALVAFAFGLAASSFFPAIILGIFSKRVNKEGAVAGMITGILFTAGYIIYFKFINTSAGPDKWLFGISPEGIGTVGMILNFVVTLVVSKITPEPPAEVKKQVEMIRYPNSKHGA